MAAGMKQRAKCPLDIKANQGFGVVDESETRDTGFSYNPNAVQSWIFGQYLHRFKKLDEPLCVDCREL